MIGSPAAFLALVLLLAGVFPALAARRPWRVFDVLPPIVLSYVAAALLAVAGCWRPDETLVEVQRRLLATLVPTLVFLMLVRCDLRAVGSLGPRVLVAFAAATASIMAGVALAWAVWRPLLPGDGWRPLAALGAGWVGGAANLVAVGHAIDLPPDGVSVALAADTLCYTVWVLVLFATVPLASRFNRFVGATRPAGAPVVGPRCGATPVAGDVLVWLGLGLAVGQFAVLVAERLPTGGIMTSSAWAILAVTAAGSLAALTPLARLPGSEPSASALLAVVVVTMGTQASLSGFANAPIFILAGFTVILCHAVCMVIAAKALGLDLALCGIASLANIGGVGSAPVLAAAHSPALVPLAVLLALCGYLLGNAAGLGLAWLLPAIGPGLAGGPS